MKDASTIDRENRQKYNKNHQFDIFQSLKNIKLIDLPSARYQCPLLK